MAKRLLQVVLGWGNSIKELFFGIIWVVLHPLRFVAELLGLVYNLIYSMAHIRKAGSFLKGALYEPYRAMTVMAVAGGILAIYSHIMHDEWFSVIAMILLSASGFAYIMWRSVEFYHGKHGSADAIDGFIFVTEMLPALSSIAVVARFIRVQSVLVRTSAMTGRITTNVAKAQGGVMRGAGALRVASKSSSRLIKTVSIHNKIVKNLSKMHKITLHTLETAQPVISMGEWINHWLKVGDNISKEIIETIKGVEKEVRGIRK